MGNPNEYNPSVLVLRVQEILGRAGIDTIVDEKCAATAVAAAADLLRALGVEPSNAPLFSNGDLT
jgi:hypothetical protein